MKPQMPATVKPKKSGTAQSPVKQQSKQAQLIELLKKKAGATVEEMIALTGWQAHTVRGIISGALKKRLGLNVVSTVSGSNGIRTYRITEIKAS